jgi:hypothetical protein
MENSINILTILRLIAVLTSHYDNKIVQIVEGLALQGSCPRYIANVANLFCFNTANTQKLTKLDSLCP